MANRGEPQLVLRVTRWHETCKRYGLESNASRARALNVDPATVTRVQAGAAVTLRFVTRACAYFHCPLDVLFEIMP